MRVVLRMLGGFEKVIDTPTSRRTIVLRVYPPLPPVGVSLTGNMADLLFSLTDKTKDGMPVYELEGT